MAKESIFEFGEDAPDFSTVDEGDRKISLSDFQGFKVVLYFYVENGTPGCTKQALSFRSHFQEIKELGAVVLGVSSDGVESHWKFKEKHRLPFTLLVDEDHKIAKAYGVWGKKQIMDKTLFGITRSHFVIDELGRILDAQIKVGASDSALLALKTLRKFSVKA